MYGSRPATYGAVDYSPARYRSPSQKYCGDPSLLPHLFDRVRSGGWRRSGRLELPHPSIAEASPSVQGRAREHRKDGGPHLAIAVLADDLVSSLLARPRLRIGDAKLCRGEGEVHRLQISIQGPKSLVCADSDDVRVLAEREAKDRE